MAGPAGPRSHCCRAAPSRRSGLAEEAGSGHAGRGPCRVNLSPRSWAQGPARLMSQVLTCHLVAQGVQHQSQDITASSSCLVSCLHLKVTLSRLLAALRGREGSGRETSFVPDPSPPEPHERILTPAAHSEANHWSVSQQDQRQRQAAPVAASS